MPTHYDYGLSDHDIDNLPDDPTGRCPGTSEHKCGRFCGKAYYCPRCEAELDAIARETLARESAWQDEKIAREQAAWDAYEADPAYRAEQERIAAMVLVEEPEEDLSW